VWKDGNATVPAFLEDVSKPEPEQPNSEEGDQSIERGEQPVETTEAADPEDTE
jgi:hypothetical protein